MSDRKIFVVTDIHGHYTQLRRALDAAGFDSGNDHHLLVCCGDYFDRGTENRMVLKYMERLPHKVLLRGNHEDMLLGVLNTGRFQPHNFINGTAETIVELFGKYALDGDTGEVDFSGQTRTVDWMIEFIEGLGSYYETDRYVFTHGWLPTLSTEEGCRIDPDWREASAEAWKKSRWTRWPDVYDTCDRLPDKTIVCGHIPTYHAAAFDSTRPKDSTAIFRGRGMIALDAGTAITGALNVLVLEE